VGEVESIGLRSTKIRRTDGALITIPNAEFAQCNIVNLTNSNYFLLTEELALKYETSSNRLHMLIAGIQALLQAHPATINTDDHPITVRFSAFSDSSLKIKIRLFISAKTRGEFLDYQQDIFFAILNLLEKQGVTLAYPSQTLYIDGEKANA
jgi:MscS family membrane protein